MALTAIATSVLRTEVTRILGMRDELVVSMSPCKANIMYAVGTFTSISETFAPMLERLRTDRLHFPQTIVYCRRYKHCSNLYLHFRRQLGTEFTEPPGAPDLSRFRLVDMYMSCTEQSVKEQIIRGFTQKGSLRLLFATVAFGVEIHCPTVREVIHLGPSCDTESYIQETGHAGRDGLPSLALLLLKPGRKRHSDTTMLRYMENCTKCRRDALFGNFDVYQEVR